MASIELLPLLALVLPVVYFTAAASCLRRLRWRLIQWLSTLGALGAIASFLTTLRLGTESQPDWLSPQPASQLLAMLIGFLGFIVVRFSKNYLAGDPRQTRFVTLLLLTLGCVSVVVISDQLWMLWAAWVGVSLFLNELLVFYPERPRAVLAAHKKYLFARIAEMALLLATILLFLEHGTWQISAIVAAYPGELSSAEQLAALLIAFTVLVKCAQLPVHGWLIQVVEAPTPVSALLHAGIINLGGYLLISFAPLMSSALAAQWLLLTVAGVTAVLAGLVMTTRVTIKVKLAWSTVAQMGLMLIECALGLYHLALLHLLAHACYKAYLFLRAGSGVEQHVAKRITAPSAVGLGGWLISGLLALGLSAVTWQMTVATGPVTPWLLLAMMLTVLFVSRSNDQLPILHSGILLGGLLLVAYVIQKSLLTGFMAPTFGTSVSVLADLWIVLLLVTLCVGLYLVKSTAESGVGLRLRTALFAGLYLDEWATRLTLKVWPLQLPTFSARTRLKAINVEGQ